jgi:hypothetical protein
MEYVLKSIFSNLHIRPFCKANSYEDSDRKTNPPDSDMS